MTLKSTLEVAIGADLTNVLDLADAGSRLAKRWRTVLADGTGAGQADRLWHDTRTILPSATDDIDLAGALLDAVGGPFSLARVKGLVVAAAAGNVNNVIVGGSATPFASWLGAGTHTVVLRPGTALALFAGAGDATGYAVAAGASDLLRIANGGAGTDVVYDIAIIGASA